MEHLSSIGLILGLALVGCATQPDAVPRTEPDALAADEAAPAEVDEPAPVVDEDDVASHEASVAEVPEAVEEPPTPEPEAIEEPPAPEPEPHEASMASLVAVPGANVTVQEVEADGQRLAELACQADRLPLFGTLAVVASIAEQRKALSRCAPDGGAVALTWTFRGGKTREVEVEHASSARAGSCAAKVMQKVVAPFEARCGAVVLLGDPAGADRSLAELRAGAGR